MNWKLKATCWLLAFATTFGLGIATGVHIVHRSEHHVRSVFTPQQDGIGEYLKFLETARKSVHIAAYSFTDERIVNKLIELRKRGVVVRVILDKSQTEGRSAPYEEKAIAALRAAGAEVVIGTSEKRHDLMHNKFTIIDGVYLQDGSWNYTKSANYQNNVLNFDDDPARAALFQENWEHMYKYMISVPVKPAKK